MYLKKKSLLKQVTKARIANNGTVLYYVFTGVMQLGINIL